MPATFRCKQSCNCGACTLVMENVTFEEACTWDMETEMPQCPLEGSADWEVLR